eukprot:CFRG8423T1
MAPAPVARRDRLSYELRTTSHETKHRFGINALAVDYYNSLLYTAGRDATVRVWDISSTVEQTEYVDEDKARTDIKYLRSSNSHTDWVNDMFLTEDGCTVVTCSSDKTVRVIDTERMLSEASLTAHTDYVKCLAYSATANRFASAGLDGSVHLWNLDTISSASKSTTMPSQYEASIYALDIDESSNHVASGGTDRVVKLWDTRSQQRTCLLKGHGDNIKVIKMLTDRMILSGASDGSVRLWDTRQQRCLHTYYIHNEGIWCMEVSDSYDKMWTSGKDCKVMETSLLDFESTFLFEERAPVHALARGGIDSNVLWAGTTHSDVNGWRCLDPKTRSSYNADMRFSDEKSALKPRPSLFGDMPSISHVNNPEDDAYLEEEMPPCLLVPTFLIEGTAGIVKYEVLNSKCRMLSLDDRGHVMLWNILTASLIKDYGEIEFEESIKSHFELEFVSNWFQCDHNTGTLTIHLDYPSCFNAEAYRDSFEDCKDSVTATEKVNLGYLVIKRLCSKWEPHGRPSNGEQSSVQVMGSVPRPLPNAYGSQFSAKGMKEGHKVDGAPLNQPLERTHMCPPMATQTQTQPQTLPESQLGIARSQNFSYSSTNTNTYTHNHGQPLHKDFFDERGSCVSEKEKQSEHEGEQRSVGVVGVREGEYGNVHVSQATSSSASLGMSDGECIGEIAGSVEGNSENKKVRVCERDEHVGVCKRNKNERGVPLSPLLNLDGRSKASQRLTTLPQTLPGLSVHDTDTHTQENTRTHTETHTHTAADTIRAPCANNGHVMSESVDMSESGHERSVSAATSSHTHVNGYSDTKSNLDTESELYFSMPDFTPIRVTELAPNSGFVHVQMLCGDFDKSSGCDAMKIHAPRFVRSCVFEDQKPQLRDIPKITFFVDPTSSPGHRREGVPIILPVMPQGNRLSANRALRVMRILRYIIEKIGPAIRSLCQLSITQAEMEKKPHEYLELFCMGKPLEPRTTLGAIKYHLWTNGEDITLQYRLK